MHPADEEFRGRFWVRERRGSCLPGWFRSFCEATPAPESSMWTPFMRRAWPRGRLVWTMQVLGAFQCGLWSTDPFVTVPSSPSGTLSGFPRMGTYRTATKIFSPVTCLQTFGNEMPLVQLTENARIDGFVTGNLERHRGLQNYCVQKENEVHTMWDIPDAQSAPREKCHGRRGVLPLPLLIFLVLTPVAGRGASRPSWHSSAAHAPLHRHLACVGPAGAHACDPSPPHGHPHGTPALLRRLSLLIARYSVFS